MAVAIGLLVSALPPPAATLRGVVPVLVIAALTGAYQLRQGDTRLAVDLAADFVSLVCLALALTTSTPLDESMGLVSRAARPLRRWIPPEALALVFSLTLRAIPELTRILGESREAARARGLERSPRAMLIPSGVRAVGYAIDVGDAITARGLADEAAATSGKSPGTIEKTRAPR
jgi:biotin transport system permease protein